MESREDEAVVSRLPEELDVGGVGHSGDGDAVGVLGGCAERLGHLLLSHTPEGGHEGYGVQEERHDRLEEGQGRGAHPLKEGHRARDGLEGEQGGRSIENTATLWYKNSKLQREFPNVSASDLQNHCRNWCRLLNTWLIRKTKFLQNKQHES